MADQPYSAALSRAPAAGRSIAGAAYACRFHPFVGVAKVQLLGPAGEALLRRHFGAELPARCREVEAGGLSCAWLAPRAWLITGREEKVAGLVERLSAELGDEGLVVDLTHARAVYLLTGKGARDALSALCPLDLSDATAPIGFSARSLLGDAGVFLSRKADEGDAPVFVLIVDQTMAAYAARMIAGPGAPLEIDP
jgi:sarcosine oxidase subunit gamma